MIFFDKRFHYKKMDINIDKNIFRVFNNKNWNKILIRLLQWFFFSIIIGILPICFSLGRLFIYGYSIDIDLLTSLLGRGELFIISCLILAAAIGELINSGKIDSKSKTVIFGICIIFLIVASFFHATIAGENFENYNNLKYSSTKTLVLKDDNSFEEKINTKTCTFKLQQFKNEIRSLIKKENKSNNKDYIDKVRVAYLSFFIYISSIISSAGCIIISEPE